MADYLKALGLGNSQDNKSGIDALLSIDTSVSGAAADFQEKAAEKAARIERGEQLPAGIGLSTSLFSQTEPTVSELAAGKARATVTAGYGEKAPTIGELKETEKRVKERAQQAVIENERSLQRETKEELTNEPYDADLLLKAITDTSASDRSSTSTSTTSMGVKVRDAANILSDDEKLKAALKNISDIQMVTSDGKDIRDAWLQSVGEVEKEAEAYKNNYFGQFVTGFMKGFKGVDVSGLFMANLNMAKEKEATLRAAVSNQYNTTINTAQILEALRNDDIHKYLTSQAAVDPKDTSSKAQLDYVGRGIISAANKGLLKIDLNPDNMNAIASMYASHIANPATYPELADNVKVVMAELKQFRPVDLRDSPTPYTDALTASLELPVGSPLQKEAAKVADSLVSSYMKTLPAKQQKDFNDVYMNANPEVQAQTHRTLNEYARVRQQQLSEQGFGATLASGELISYPATRYYTERKFRDPQWYESLPQVFKDVMDNDVLEDSKSTETWFNNIMNKLSSRLIKEKATPQELSVMSEALSTMFTEMQEELININKGNIFLDPAIAMKLKVSNLPQLSYGNENSFEVTNPVMLQSILNSANRTNPIIQGQ